MKWGPQLAVYHQCNLPSFSKLNQIHSNSAQVTKFILFSLWRGSISRSQTVHKSEKWAWNLRHVQTTAKLSDLLLDRKTYYRATVIMNCGSSKSWKLQKRIGFRNRLTRVWLLALWRRWQFAHLGKYRLFLSINYSVRECSNGGQKFASSNLIQILTSPLKWKHNFGGRQWNVSILLGWKKELPNRTKVLGMVADPQSYSSLEARTRRIKSSQLAWVTKQDLTCLQKENV